MATADLLLELMFSWIDQRERCAEQLKKLADELESLREKCNASECVGNSVSVVGAACLLGAGAGVGVGVSAVTQLIEHFVSSDTMKDAEKIEKESNNIAQRIQKQFDQLKAEIKKVNPSADLDEVDRHVMTELLGAMSRRSGLKIKIDFSKLRDMLQRSSHQDMNMQLNQRSINTMQIVLVGILTFFAFQNSGKSFKLLIAEGTKRLIKQMSTTGVKTAFKGGAMMVGGAVGLAFALPEAVDSWKEAIKKNHVTEASQSLRDTADTILKMSRKLREEFDNMRKMLKEMAEQQEQERIRKAEQQEQERIRKAEQQEQERIEMARRQQEQEQQNKQTGSEQQGRDDQGDEERDQEDEERDHEDEERDQEDEERDQEDEERDHEDEERDQEDEERDQEDEERDQEDEERDQEDEERDQEDEERDQEDEERDQEDEERDQEDEERDQEDEERDQEDEERDQEDEERDQEDEERDQEDEERDQEDEERDHEDEERDHEDGFPNITTFEYVATVLQHDTWNEPILFINVYRPPTSRTRGDLEAFLKEFQSLLDHYRNKNYNNIVVAGDFNIHVDAVKSIPSRFLEFLRNNNLVQHVNKPTHRGNHTLDLVISRNVDISDLSVQNDRISDHYTVSFTVSDQEGKAVKVGLLNCRSVNKKTEKIRDLIERNNLDILLLTETWTNDTTAKEVLRNASPEGFSFCYESRTEGRGGGVAILFRAGLQQQQEQQNEQTGSEQQGGDDQEDEERDQEDEERDHEDEERDQEDEERDQEDEERDQEDEERDQEDEERDQEDEERDHEDEERDQEDEERDQEDEERDQGDEERDQEDEERDHEDEERDHEDEERDQEDEERDQEDEERDQEYKDQDESPKRLKDKEE